MDTNTLSEIRARLDELKESYLAHVRQHGELTFGVHDVLQIAYDLLDNTARLLEEVERRDEREASFVDCLNTELRENYLGDMFQVAAGQDFRPAIKKLVDGVRCGERGHAKAVAMLNKLLQQKLTRAEKELFLCTAWREHAEDELQQSQEEVGRLTHERDSILRGEKFQRELQESRLRDLIKAEADLVREQALSTSFGEARDVAFTRITALEADLVATKGVLRVHQEQLSNTQADLATLRRLVDLFVEYTDELNNPVLVDRDTRLQAIKAKLDARRKEA